MSTPEKVYVKTERITFRATPKVLERIEGYRAWLQNREQDRVSTSRAVGKLLQAGLAQFEREVRR